jgi:hypothetical protein
MTDVMQRCVPISSGALAPDLRVNYQFGLVLGVDELEQEDLYFRERDERAARSLHGYGTTVGLHVTAARPVAAPDDVEVRVERGILIDQYGRPVVIRTDQCARVGAWLASQELEGSAATPPVSPLQDHLRPSGDLTVYVVAEYSSCEDALVPLPGNPCGTEDEVTAASRIRDFWKLGFRWEPPDMPHWDGVRALADLLAPIEWREGSLLESDEAALAAHVRALAPGAPAPAVTLPVPPVLPRAEGRAALDRLLTIWVTEVRPKLAPDLIEPGGEAAVLLSSITLVPASPFDTNSPAITEFSLPDDEGRPYLAPTQLIQELVMLGGGVTTVLAGSPLQPAPTPAGPTLIELASITEVGVGPGRQLVLWSHLTVPLVLPATVAVSRNGGSPIAFTTSPGPAPGTFRLSPAGGVLVDGELLEVRLDLTQLRVREGTVETALPVWLQQQGLDVLGRRGDQLSLRHTVLPTPPPQQPPAPPRPVRQLATALPVRVDNELPGIELWWHVDKEAPVDEERVIELPREVLHILAEVDNAPTPVEIPIEGLIQVQHNVFQLIPDFAVWREQAQLSPYLRLAIEIDQVQLEQFGGDAASYADALGVAWEDAQRDGQLLVLWVRMAGQLR